MSTSFSKYIRHKLIEPLRERNRQMAQRHIFELIEDGCAQGIAVTLDWVPQKEEAQRKGIEFIEPSPTLASVAARYPIRLPKRPTGRAILPSDYIRLKYIEPLKYRNAMNDLRDKDKIRAIGRAEGISATLNWMHQKEKTQREGIPFVLPIPNPKSVTAKHWLRYRQYRDKNDSSRFILPVAYIYYKFIDPSFQRWRAEGYALGYVKARFQI